jgi:hypothetical protein
VENQLSEPSVAQFAQFQFPTDYYSYPSATVPLFEPLQFNYYYPYPVLDIAPIQDSMTESSTCISPNYFSPEKNLQYFIVPQVQQFDVQYPQINFFDSPNSSLFSQSNFVEQPQSNFVKQSPKVSQPYSNQLNLKVTEKLVNMKKNSAIDETKLEKKKLQNRAAAQRAREKEKILIENLRNENESLMKEYEEKVEEMKRLKSILDELKRKNE